MSFRNLDLRHYHSRPFRLDHSRRYMRPELEETLGWRACTADNGKPRGLWVSVKGPNDWPEWCQAGEFYLEEIATEHRVTLWPNANILTITGFQEFDDFHARYETDLFGLGERRRYRDTDHRGNPLPEYTFDYIDWGAVAKDYDGIIIAPYLYNRRLDGPSWYYGWDAASGCIWNLRAIRKLEWMVPEVEEMKRRMQRWIDVAAEQAINRIKYGTSDPTGGRGRQQYPINHPMFPVSETEREELDHA